MKLLLLLLIVSIRASAQTGRVDSIGLLTNPLTPFDSVTLVTYYQLHEGGAYNNYVSVIDDDYRVQKSWCFEQYMGGSLAVFNYTDTVRLRPYGSTGYWFHFLLRVTSDDSGCDAAYRSADSILIGPDPYLAITDAQDLKQGFSLYPNPSTNQATLSVLPSPTAVLRLTDVVGQPVPFWRDGRELWLEDLPPGIYFLHLRDGERRYTTKLMKQ